MKKIFFFLSTIVLALTSCSTTKSAYSLGGEWDVVNLQGKEVKPETNVTPFLGFNLNEGKVYGFTGCNRLTGTIDAQELASGTADFSKMGSTRMLCHDDKYERSFLEALGQVNKSELKNNVLKLSDKKGNVLITLKKRKK